MEFRGGSQILGFRRRHEHRESLANVKASHDGGDEIRRGWSPARPTREYLERRVNNLDRSSVPVGWHYGNNRACWARGASSDSRPKYVVDLGSAITRQTHHSHKTGDWSPLRLVCPRPDFRDIDTVMQKVGGRRRGVSAEILGNDVLPLAHWKPPARK